MKFEGKATIGAEPDKSTALWEGQIEPEFGVAAARYRRER